MIGDLVKIFLPTMLAFFGGIFITPVATHFFYKYKMWKRYSRSKSVSSSEYQKIHNEKEELNTPRVGGIIIWLTVVLVTTLFYLLFWFFPSQNTTKINFLSRSQTLIPFFTLIIGSLIGLWDDLLQIFSHSKFAQDDINWRNWKVFLIFSISLLIGLWFFLKLDMTTVHIPFGSEFYIGALIVPFFVLVALATFSGGVIDGLDGLSGGVFASIFSAYAVIAYSNSQIDIAAFSAVVAGVILAFLWFNVPPARFYMGETGVMGLTVTLATIAFLTDTVLLLPIIAMPLVITSFSVILQTTSKKLFNGKKVFRVAPIHHHFEAIGWSAPKVVMRFWILSIIFAIIGIILAAIS